MMRDIRPLLAIALVAAALGCGFRGVRIESNEPNVEIHAHHPLASPHAWDRGSRWLKWGATPTKVNVSTNWDNPVMARKGDRLLEFSIPPDGPDTVRIDFSQKATRLATRVELAILKYELLIGMTMDEAKQAWGRASDRSTLTSASGVREFWHYRTRPNGLYATLLFQNGRLESFTSELPGGAIKEFPPEYDEHED